MKVYVSWVGIPGRLGGETFFGHSQTGYPSSHNLGGGFKCFWFSPRFLRKDPSWLIFFQMGWNHGSLKNGSISNYIVTCSYLFNLKRHFSCEPWNHGRKRLGKTGFSAEENKFQALNNAVNCLATLPVPVSEEVFLEPLERWIEYMEAKQLL